MTISRQEKPVPTRLPAARLYLDDIEDIVRILSEADQSREAKSNGFDKDAPIKVQFQIGNQMCDEVQDLPKIAKNSPSFELQVSRGRFGLSARLGVSRYGTQWTTYGLTKDEAWTTFRRLEALFESRRLPWTHLLHSHFTGFLLIHGFMLSLLCVSFMFLPASLAGRLPHSTAVAVVAMFVTAAIVAIALWVGLRRHSIVILRYSWDHAALREDTKTKLIIAGASSIITFGLTFLGMYLKHKFWS